MLCDLRKYLQRQLYFFGDYEAPNCAYWIERAATAHTIFDVGANVGVYSLLAAASNPDAQIHAFEPSSDVAAALLRNVRMNHFQSITVNVVAVADTSGKIYLHPCTGDSGDNEGMNFVLQEGAEGSLLTDSMSLDDYCSQHGIDHIDLLKLDIEGGEHDALIGARRLLEAQSIDCIFMELSDWTAKRSGHSTMDISELLLNYGYSIYTITSGRLQPVPDHLHTHVNEIVASRDHSGSDRRLLH
jgi:FkbM family methyltransferase